MKNLFLYLVISLNPVFSDSDSYLQLTTEIRPARKMAREHKTESTVTVSDIGLDLSKQILSSVPVSVSEFENLIYLDLSCNKIQLDKSDIENISKLTSLKELDLSFNNVEKINNNISKLTKCKNLSVLNLLKNPIKYIDKSINDVESLQALNLTFCELEEVPSVILENTHIKYLFLSLNKLDKIPDFSKMVNLQVLDLSNNTLKDTNFPPEFLPKSIKEIGLEGTGISSSEISNLKKVFPELDVSY